MVNWIYMIGEIEKKVGELYLTISKKTENVYPEVSALFHQLYKDEVQHTGQADFISTLCKESEASLHFNDRNSEILSDRIRLIDDATRVIAEKEMYLHPVDLLKMAMEIEEEMGEGHELVSEGIADPELKNLIRSMGLEDKAHKKRIHDFLAEYERGAPGLEDPQ